MRLGGPVYIDSRDPEEIVRAHVAEGYGAAYCPGWLSVDDSALLREFDGALRRRDIVLAEVGAWGNIIHPDREVARANRERVVQKLALADALGARCCVDYTGSYGPGWYHAWNLTPEAFDEIVEVTRAIIDTVHPTRTVFALEMMPSVHPESAADYQRLLAAVDRPGQFGVHLDPVNLVNSPRRFFGNGALIKDCFDRLGPHIASCHAKDIRIGDEFVLHLSECRPGTGSLDYRTYLSELGRLPQEPPLMLEHLPSQADYHQARDHLAAVAAALGLCFHSGSAT